MSTSKLLALVIAFTAALLALVAAASFAFNGWLAHLLVSADSVASAVAIGVVFVVPALVFGLAAAFAVEKPLD